LSETKKTREQLEADIEECELKIVRATNLLDGLGGEQTRWELEIKDLKERQISLSGDAMLAGGLMAYLSAYATEYRVP